MNRRILVVFVCMLVSHFLIQFVSWSFALGNTAVTGTNIFNIIWKIMSFPFFYSLPQDWVNRFFWFVFVGNSLAWGLLALGLIKIFCWVTK